MTVIRTNKEGNDDERVQDKVRASDDPHRRGRETSAPFLTFRIKTWKNCSVIAAKYCVRSAILLRHSLSRDPRDPETLFQPLEIAPS
jgi:hypothetical protein